MVKNRLTRYKYWLFVLGVQLIAIPLAWGVDPTSVNELITGGGSSSSLSETAYGIFTNLQTDLSIFLLSQLFGSAGNILQGTGSELSATLLGYFNIAIWVVVGGILAYTITMGSLRFSQEGRFIGESFSIAAVFRNLFGIGLLIPQFSGLSLIQVLCLWAVLQGVNLANGVWGSVLNYASTLGTPSNVSSIGLQQEATEEDRQRTLLSMTQLLHSEVCLDLVRRYNTNPSKTIAPFYDLPNKRLIFGTQTRSSRSRHSYSWGLCGVYSWSVSDNTLGKDYETYKLEALRQADAILRPVAKRIVDQAMQKKNPVEAAGSPLVCDNPDNKEANPGCIACLSVDEDEVGEGSVCSETVGLVSAMSTYLKIMVAPRLNELAKAQNNNNSTTSFWINEARKSGWLLAGSYHYFLMSRASPVILPTGPNYLTTADTADPDFTSPPYVTLDGNKRPTVHKNKAVRRYFRGRLAPSVLQYALRTVCDPDKEQEAGTIVCNKNPTRGAMSLAVLTSSTDKVNGYMSQADRVVDALYSNQYNEFNWSSTNKNASQRDLKKEEDLQDAEKKASRRERRFRKRKKCLKYKGKCVEKEEKERESLSASYTEQLAMDDQAFMRLISQKLEKKALHQSIFTRSVSSFLFDIWNAWVSLTSSSGEGAQIYTQKKNVGERILKATTLGVSVALHRNTHFLNQEFANPLANIREFGMSLIAAVVNFIDAVTHQIFKTLIKGAITTSVVASVLGFFGGYLVDLAEDLLHSKFFVFFLVGLFLRAIGSAIKEGEALPGLVYQVTMAAAFLRLPLVLAFVSPVIVLGLLTAVYVPLLPYFIFTFASVGWLILVVESVAAAPLIALGVAHPQGHDYLGRAEIALMLLLSVFVRPAMMILGLVLGMLLLIIIMPFLNSTFYLVFNVMIIVFASSEYSNTVLWVGSIGLMLVYVSFIMAIVKFAYSPVYSLADRILRWLGGQAEDSGILSLLNDIVSRFAQVVGSMGAGASAIATRMRSASIPLPSAALQGVGVGKHLITKKEDLPTEGDDED